MSNGPQPPPASHPITSEQLPAAYRFKVGGFECTVVSDGPLKLGTFTEEMFRGISQERIDAILAANFLDRNDFTVDQNAVVVNTGSKLVLIDTGMGYRKIYGRRTGHLLANLRAAGIDPASIDLRALSHAHPDHVWGSSAKTASRTSRTPRSISARPTSSTGPTKPSSPIRRSATTLGRSATHCCRCSKNGDGYRYVAIEMQTVL